MKRGFLESRLVAFLLLGALALPLTITASTDRAGAQVTLTGGPDFSAVTTKTAANKLVRKGDLVKVHFFPTELGGPDEPHNIGYVTPFAAEMRELVIGTFMRYREKGLIDRMEVVPDYKGVSVIPSRITMTGWHGEKPGSFAVTIQIW